MSTTAPSTTEGQAAPPSTTAASPPNTYEVIDPATDPFGFRRQFLRVPASPEHRWTVTTELRQVIGLSADDDVIVAAYADRTNDHTLVVRNRASGEALWSVGNAEDRVQDHFTLDGVLVVSWVRPPDIGTTIGYDPLSGEELWRLDIGENKPEVQRYGLVAVRRFGASGSDPAIIEIIDPATGQTTGSYTPAGASGRGFVARDGESVVELHPQTLEPLGDPIPIGPVVATAESLVIVGDTVVTTDEGLLELRDRSGAVTASVLIDPAGSVSVLRPSIGSPVVAVYDSAGSVGVDPATRLSVWQREGWIGHFGELDGDYHLMVRQPARMELFSLTTGATRCVIEGEELVGQMQNGFVVGTTFFDLDCEERWTLPESADTEYFFIDAGVLQATEVDGELLLTLLE